MRNLCLIIAMEELTIYMKKRTHTSLLINSFHFLMKYFSFSSVYMLSWYFSCFVHSAWEGVNKRGNFSCLQLPFYCKNLKRIKNANQFISFLFSFLSVSSASVCVLYLFIKRRLRDHDPVLLSYYMQFRPQHGTNCDLFCSSSEASRGGGGVDGGWGRRTSISLPTPPTTCRWRGTQLIRKFIHRIKKKVFVLHIPN